MSDIRREINDNRQKQGKNPIPQSTFYRFVNSRKESLTAPRELQWLFLFGINVVDTYNLANARASLSDIFTYSDLKTFGGIDIDSLASRLQEAQKWFQETYPGADPFEWFPRIRLRSKVIRNHWSRIKADKSLSDQAELELMKQHQVDYEKIYERLKKLTNNFSEAEITHHHTTAQVLLDLCRDERKWVFLTEEEKKRLSNNKLIQNLREPKQYLKAVLTKKLISYIRKGKITFTHSFNYQDIGKVIESVELSDTARMVTRGDIEKLIFHPALFERCHDRPRIPAPLEYL